MKTDLNRVLPGSDKNKRKELSDAMGSLGAMCFNIKPVKTGMKAAGTALTVKVKPGDNLFLHQAIYLSGLYPTDQPQMDLAASIISFPAAEFR